MIVDCDQCSCKLNTATGSIIVYFPHFMKGIFVVFKLCRPCFLEADAAGGKWKPPEKQEVPAE